MSEAKHTAGPWRLSEMITRQGWRMIESPTELANIPICLIDVGSEADEANIRLIAAAPELLEACKAIATEVNWQSIELVEAAIAKAENQEAPTRPRCG